MSDDEVKKPRELGTGDWLLRSWIAGAYGTGEGFSVVLTTAAGIISGKIISEARYFESLGDVLGDAFGEAGEEFRTMFDGYKKIDKSLPIKQIHLRDAQLYTLQGAIPIGSKGLWRGDLSAIIGHAIGQVTLTPVAGSQP